MCLAIPTGNIGHVGGRLPDRSNIDATRALEMLEMLEMFEMLNVKWGIVPRAVECQSIRRCYDRLKC